MFIEHSRLSGVPRGPTMPSPPPPSPSPAREVESPREEDMQSETATEDASVPMAINPSPPSPPPTTTSLYRRVPARPEETPEAPSGVTCRVCGRWYPMEPDWNCCPLAWLTPPPALAQAIARRQLISAPPPANDDTVTDPTSSSSTAPTAQRDRMDSSRNDRRQVSDNTTNFEDGAIYCPDCEMWLNGPTPWEDHKIGKKHAKSRRRRAGEA